MPSINFGKRITAAVGTGGSNLPGDVNTIKYLINNVPQTQGGPSSPFSTGSGINELSEAIRKFQTFQFGGRDGRVDPGGRTLSLLHGFDPTPNGPVFVPGVASGKKGDSGKKRGPGPPVPPTNPPLRGPGVPPAVPNFPRPPGLSPKGSKGSKGGR